MKISVCIPTYNQAAYLTTCIDSVLQQSVPIYEIIVADDCSTDSTLPILELLAEKHKEIQIVRRETNLGITKNTDDCLRRASGDFVIRLDSDDFLHTDYAKKLVALMQKFPNAGYAHCAIQEVDKADQFLLQRKLYRKDIYQEPDVALRASVKGYRVAANIIMFRKKVLSAVDYLQSPINFAEDYYLTASVSSFGYGNVYCSDVLAYYRVWTDAGNVRQKRKLAEIQGLRYVFDDVIEPAFKKRNWDLGVIHSARKRFAINHSNSLSWSNYNSEEKKELKEDLLLLSSTSSVKLYIALYEKGWGKPLIVSGDLKKMLKRFLKKYL